MGAGGDEAASGGIGGASFHSSAVGEAGQELVGVFESFGAAVRVGEGVVFDSHAFAKEGMLHDLATEEGYVEGRRVLAGFGESMGVFEMRLAHAHGAGHFIHAVAEVGFRSGNVSGEGFCNVVAAADEESFDEGFAGVGFSGFNIEFGWFDLSVGSGHGDGVGEEAAARNDEGGEELLSACDGSLATRIFLVKDSSGSSVDDDGAFGPNDWSVGGRGIDLRRLWANDERTWIGTLNAGGGSVCAAGDEKKANGEGENLPNGHKVKIAGEGGAGKGFAVVEIGIKENRGRVSLGRHRPRLSHTRKFYHIRLSYC